MSAERDELLQITADQLRGARASIDAALALIGLAMEPEDAPNPADTDRDPTPQYPPSFGAAMSSTAEPLTRERIRADLDSSRADATGAAFDPLTNTHAE